MTPVAPRLKGLDPLGDPGFQSWPILFRELLDLVVVLEEAGTSCLQVRGVFQTVARRPSGFGVDFLLETIYPGGHDGESTEIRVSLSLVLTLVVR